MAMRVFMATTTFEAMISVFCRQWLFLAIFL